MGFVNFIKKVSAGNGLDRLESFQNLQLISTTSHPRWIPGTAFLQPKKVFVDVLAFEATKSVA